MMRIHEREKKSRQKIAAENMTTVQRIQRALQSGPVKSELRTVQETIHLARALSAQAKNAMDLKGLNHAKDFAVVIAYMTPDLTMLFTRKFEPGKEREIQADLEGPEKCCIMVGLIFGIRDHEHGGEWLFGVGPFLVTSLVVNALKQRIEEDVIGIN